VAHFGRGRGEWTESEHPAHWQDAVRAVLEERRAAFDLLWARRAQGESEQALAGALQTELTQAARIVLARLYPPTAALADKVASR
jgi:hypothetical protein